MSTSEQVNFVFRHQPKKSSKYGVLLTYINADGAEMTRSDRLLHPAAAFWLPFAYQHCTDVSSTELQQLARSAVYQLKLHIQYLEDSFGLQVTSWLSEKPQTEKKMMSSNGWHKQDDSQESEDFSDEDDILSHLI
jgi:hypothetical protein